MTSYQLSSNTPEGSQMRILGYLLRFINPRPIFDLLKYVVTGSPDLSKAESGLEQSGGTIAAIVMLLIFVVLQFGCVMYADYHSSFTWISELLQISNKNGIGIYFDLTYDIAVGLLQSAIVIFTAAWLLKKWANIGVHIRWLFFGLTCTAYILSGVRYVVTAYLEDKAFETANLWSGGAPIPSHINLCVTAAMLLIASVAFWYTGVLRVEGVVGRERAGRGFWHYRFMISAAITTLYMLAELTSLHGKATFQEKDLAYFEQTQTVRPNPSATLIAMINECGSIKEKITCAVTLSPGYPQNFTLYGDWTSKVMAEEATHADQIGSGVAWRLRSKKDNVFPYLSLTPMRLENVEIEAAKIQACSMGKVENLSTRQIRVHFGVLGRVNALNPGVRSTIDLIVSDSLSMFEDITKACQ